MSGRSIGTEASTAPQALPEAGRAAPRGATRWVPVAALGLLLLALSRNVGSGISDPDALWHVLAGDHLRRTWSFIGPDPLSDFTIHPWALTQWLPELAMSGANQWGGLPAVEWLAQLGRVGVCVAVYVGCRRASGPLPATLVTGIAVLGTASSLSPRPQLVGFALLAVTTSAWLRTSVDLRPRWWLVPLTWLWASSHGTWVIGLAVGAAVVVGLAAERTVQGRDLARLALVPAASAVAALITPLGPRILETFGTVRAVSPYIQEWRRPGWTELSTIALFILVLMVGAAWLAHRELVRWSHVLLLGLGMALGLTTARTVAVGAIVVAPLAARSLDRVMGRARPALGREPVFVAGMVAAALTVCAVLASGAPQVPVGVPSRLAPALRALPDGTVVYNDDALGGWLMISYPGLHQTADTRAELYGSAQARNYLRTMSAHGDWRRSLDARGVGAALVSERVPLASALQREAGWRLAGRDHGYILLLPPAPSA